MILSFGSLSCDHDLLETVPNDRISTEIYWQTPDDALFAVNSLYHDLEGTGIFLYDALTDIGHVNQPFNINSYIEQGNYDALNATVYNYWSAAYTGIAAVNYFLENVDRVPFSDEGLRNRYKAEARVLRAYQYIKLVTLYGDVPLVKNTLTLGESRKLARDGAAAVWAFVDSELEEVVNHEWLPDSYEAKDRGRITHWAALGLKARAALYAGNYRNAAGAAGKIITEGGFELYPRYEKLFSYEAEDNQEILLDKQFIKDTYRHDVFSLLAPYSQKNANSTYVPAKALVDLYQTAGGLDIADDASYDASHPYDNRDPRLRFSIFLDGDDLPGGNVFHPAPNSGTPDAIGGTYIASTTGFNVKKYVNVEDYANITNSGINIILLRYAEVLLTYAEAKIALNEVDDSVYEAINKVRNGRTDVQLPDVTATQETALKDIVRKERTVELAFEGLHLADIRRWRTAEAVLPGRVYGITYVDDDGETKVYETAITRAFRSNRDYLWPVPQKERDLNPNLTQNPYW